MRLRLPAFFSRHRRWADGVSAYADNELGAAERERFDAHLAGCERCSNAVGDETALKRMLAEVLPEQPAPRSFALTPGMVNAGSRAQQPVGPAFNASGQVIALARVMQFSAAAAVLGFAALLVVDVSGGGNGSTFQAAGDAGTTGALQADDGRSAEGAGGPTAAEDPAPASDPPPLPTVAGGAGGQFGREQTEAPKDTEPEAQTVTTDSSLEPLSEPDLQAMAGGERGNSLRAFQVALGMLAVACAGTWLIARRVATGSSRA